MKTIEKFNIMDFGVEPNIATVQTKSIQACIDTCRDAGGGEVVIPRGSYLVGSLKLYSDITLRLKTGAILLGSKVIDDYEDFKVPTSIQYLKDEYYKQLWHLPDYYFYAMITAYEATNIKIIGEPGSIINGQDAFDENGEEKFRGPMGIIMSNVKDLSLEGYTFENSANWSHTLDGCENVRIKQVTIQGGHDGFNLHHSRKMTVSDCRLECGDDCFAGYDVENLTVSHCYLNTGCNSLRLGGVDITFADCLFSGPGRYPHRSKDTYHTHAIFKYYAIRPDEIPNDATNIGFRNCIIKDADKLFYYDNGNEEANQNNRPLRDFYLENVHVTGIRHTSLFRGNGEKAQLSLKNVVIDFESKAPFLEIDENITLNFDKVDFIKPTVIQIGSGKRIFVHGLTTFKFVFE
ncbi:glycoside hydrolase family 28 protein [Vagococcus allomyrinae]|nr:glycosyl hydrolase family 28 protein [Vagococcus allomyrinae]